MSMVIGIIISVLTGVCASALFWWWQAKLLRPKITICPTLARYEEGNGDRRCQFRIVNSGRRPVAEIAIRVQAVMPGLVHSDKKEILDIREIERPWLGNGKVVTYTIRSSYLTQDSKRRYRQYFPPTIADALLADPEIEVDMQDFLSSCKHSVIRIYVASSDTFSGARAFVTREFTSEDFRDGPFVQSGCDHMGHYHYELKEMEDLAHE
jgi:hypothetical protein